MHNILELQQVSKHFGGIKAVDELTIGFEQGKITALIGPNGAGKTTAFNLIGGLLRPDSGSMAFNGKRLFGLKPWHIARLGIGRLFQDVRLFNKMTVLENVMTAFQWQRGESLWRVAFAPWTQSTPEARHKEQAMRLLQTVGLPDKANSLAENLSYGQQKLVAIARLLAADAKLLLLDEPTAGVNPVMIRQFFTTIRQLVAENCTILFIEHNMEIVRELAERAIFMSAGKIMKSGSPADVFADPNVRSAYIGKQITQTC